MRQITAIEINGQLYRYPGVTYQTDCGVLLSFQKDTQKWDGVYPGYSWDKFYEDLLSMNTDLITPDVAKRYRTCPLFIWPFKEVGMCQRPVCDQSTESQYCSVDCWYFDTLEMIRYAIANASSLNIVDANVRYMEKLIAKFGSSIQLCSDAHGASELVFGLLPVRPFDL